MTTFKNIPQPTDQRTQSQADILANMQYLVTPVNPTPGVPVGILNIDHQATGNNSSGTTDGFHNQVSMIARTTPTTLANSYTGACNGIAYVKTDGAGNGQLSFFNGTSGAAGGQMDFPISCIKAFCTFVAANATTNARTGSFNVALSGNSIVWNASGFYTIKFTNALPNTNFVVLGMGTISNAGTNLPSIITEYNSGTGRSTTQVQIYISDGGSNAKAPLVSIAVIGF